MKKLIDYLDLPISEFWASRPGGVADVGDGSRPVVDVVPNPPQTPVIPNWRTAIDLMSMMPDERLNWYTITGGVQANMSLLLSLYAGERNLPRDQQTRFVRR